MPLHSDQAALRRHGMATAAEPSGAAAAPETHLVKKAAAESGTAPPQAGSAAIRLPISIACRP